MNAQPSILSALTVAAALCAQPAAAGQSTPWVNVLCKFADSAAVEPQPPGYFDGLLGDDLPAPTYPTLDHYIRAVSYGLTDIAGSFTTQWVTVAQPLDFYHRNENGVLLGNGYLNRDRLYQDCTQAAESQVHFPDYYGINVMMNLDVSAWSGTRRQMTLDGVTRDWGVTVIGNPSYMNQQTVAHEMLHGYGVQHSGTFLNNGNGGYGNYWDVLSSPPHSTSDPTYGWIGPHPIAHQKYVLGWVGGNWVFHAPTTTNECWRVRIDRLSIASPVNYLMARIPYGGAGHYYTLEARTGSAADDYDSVLGAPEALVIHEIDEGRDEKALVVDPDGNHNSGDAGARWTAGEFFELPGQFRVNVEAVDPEGVDVRIIRPPAEPDGVRPGTVTDQTIEVLWNGHAPCAEESQLQMRECVAGGPECLEDREEMHPLPADARSWIHRGVERGVPYQYRVRFCLAGGESCSAWSKWSPRIVAAARGAR